MYSKKVELESMSVDELWSLHEKVSVILSARIKAEKNELEKRLAVLDRGGGAISQPGEALASDAKRRRKRGMQSHCRQARLGGFRLRQHQFGLGF